MTARFLPFLVVVSFVVACGGGETCPEGRQLCDGSCVDLATDVNHCGACANACEVANGTAACAASACTVSACDAGFDDCDSDLANGCETDLSDPASCGACGTACDDGNPCTADRCDASGCVNDGTGITDACDDGSACTNRDACQGDAAGTCAGDAVICDDGNACTTDSCDPATGCDNDGTGVTDACDDGNACTTGDACQGDVAGTCAGTDTSAVDCDDGNGCTADTCDAATGCSSDGTGITDACDDGNACTTGDACQGDAVGSCAGTDTSATDCDDGNGCTADACDPASGCSNDGTGVIDACDDGNACTTGDACQGDASGTCAGTDTSATDCDDGNTCTTDACDPATGCSNDGTGNTSACDDGSVCTTGEVCQGDAVGTCTGAPIDCDDGNACTSDSCDPALGCINDGSGVTVPCNDWNLCTTSDACQGDVAGSCSGNWAIGCNVYYLEDFESVCPPAGWTLGGDWQCGVPTSGPNAAYGGGQCVATNLTGNYASSQAYDTAIAQLPPLDLSVTTEPVLSFYAWVHTEGGYDAFNVKVSTDGGASFSQFATVVPPFNDTISSEDVWTGNWSSDGWRLYSVDLGPYRTSTAIFRFAFRSDGALSYPGVYVDDVTVSEANAVPLAITTPSPLDDAAVGFAYAQNIQRTGGSSAAVWSIAGGTNVAWLSIDPATGVLSGTPAAGDAGPVSVIVRVEEPANPVNFVEATLDFVVVTPFYFQDFEGACPNGWTLTGDWQCGTPTNGPGVAFAGTQCLATSLTDNYSNSVAWGSTYALSPAIDLAAATAPRLTFRGWVHTEGGSWDGTNLKISTDGGTTFGVLTPVAPAYNLTVGGEPAWGGQFAMAWTEFSADLSAYAGQVIHLRFELRSDVSVRFAGMYVDNLLVAQ